MLYFTRSFQQKFWKYINKAHWLLNQDILLSVIYNLIINYKGNIFL